MYSAGASLSLFTQYTPWYNIAAHNLAMVMIVPAKCQYVVSVPSSALGNALERLQGCCLEDTAGAEAVGGEATQVKGEDQRGVWRGGRSCDSTGSFHVVFLRHRRRGVWCGGASTDKPATPLAPATPAILDPAALSAALAPAALPPSSPYPKSCILNP